MRNITALNFASLFGDLLLAGPIPPPEVSKKLRETADMMDSRPPKLVLYEAYSMEEVQQNTRAYHFNSALPSADSRWELDRRGARLLQRASGFFKEKRPIECFTR